MKTPTTYSTYSLWLKLGSILASSFCVTTPAINPEIGGLIGGPFFWSYTIDRTRSELSCKDRPDCRDWHVSICQSVVRYAPPISSGHFGQDPYRSTWIKLSSLIMISFSSNSTPSRFWRNLVVVMMGCWELRLSELRCLLGSWLTRGNGTSRIRYSDRRPIVHDYYGLKIRNHRVEVYQCT